MGYAGVHGEPKKISFSCRSTFFFFFKQSFVNYIPLSRKLYVHVSFHSWTYCEKSKERTKFIEFSWKLESFFSRDFEIDHIWILTPPVQAFKRVLHTFLRLEWIYRTNTRQRDSNYDWLWFERIAQNIHGGEAQWLTTRRSIPATMQRFAFHPPPRSLYGIGFCGTRILSIDRLAAASRWLIRY